MHVHAHVILHTCLPTRTRSVYTRVLMSHSMYILQFVSVLELLVQVSREFSLHGQ